MITINAAIYNQPMNGRETYSLIIRPTAEGQCEYEVTQIHDNYRITVLKGVADSPKKATLEAIKLIFEEPPERN